jgi:hypothetical protein
LNRFSSNAGNVSPERRNRITARAHTNALDNAKVSPQPINGYTFALIPVTFWLL